MGFFETLRVEDGEILNLKYHNLRLNKTIHDIYSINSDFNLIKISNP